MQQRINTLKPFTDLIEIARIIIHTSPERIFSLQVFRHTPIGKTEQVIVFQVDLGQPVILFKIIPKTIRHRVKRLPKSYFYILFNFFHPAVSFSIPLISFKK
ncbi:hypothetical protein FQZ97_949680 [compost metagenome]